MIRDKKYFALHAPWQTGETSPLLARTLTVEEGEARRENVAEALRTVLAALPLQASVTLSGSLADLCAGVLWR